MKKPKDPLEEEAVKHIRELQERYKRQLTNREIELVYWAVRYPELYMRFTNGKLTEDLELKLTPVNPASSTP